MSIDPIKFGVTDPNVAAKLQDIYHGLDDPSHWMNNETPEFDKYIPYIKEITGGVWATERDPVLYVEYYYNYTCSIGRLAAAKITGKWVCYCNDIDCIGDCGVLPCGCIDCCRCRGR
jgi:hypothetical protein